MAGLSRILPQSVYVQLDARRAHDQLNSLLYKANQGLATLHGMENDLGTIPERIEDINTEWLNNTILAKTDVVKRMPLPQSTINSMLADWQQIKEKAVQAIGSILAIYTAIPLLQCEVKDGQIICNNAAEWIKNKATFEVPSKYKEHYRLVGNVIEAANKLRYYEKKNALKSFPIDMLVNSILSAEDYTRFITEGTFEKEMSQEQFNRLYYYELSRL